MFFFCCRLLNFFQNLLFQEILSRALSESQMVWIEIRTDILSVLTWVQTVYKGFQPGDKSTRNMFYHGVALESDGI